MQCQVISLINWKSGVGKTTFTHHLGTGLQRLTKAERRKYFGEARLPRVLLIDSDAQCNLSVACLTANHFEELIYKEEIGSIRHLYKEFLEREDTKLDVNSFILKNAVQSENERLYEPARHTVNTLKSNDFDSAEVIARLANMRTEEMNEYLYGFKKDQLMEIGKSINAGLSTKDNKNRMVALITSRYEFLDLNRQIANRPLPEEGAFLQDVIDKMK